LATFAVDRALPQNRLQLSFTLVLTGVAFKFVANQSIPKISYLTHLVRNDEILNFYFVIIVYTTVVHTVYVTMADPEISKREGGGALLKGGHPSKLAKISGILGLKC
jgi:hypothetical protein